MWSVEPNTSFHRTQTARLLLTAAVALVEEGGRDRFTVREVARRVGVSHAAPYRHFSDKQALLAAVAAFGFQGLGSSTRAAFEAEASSVEGLLAAGRAYIHFAMQRFHRGFTWINAATRKLNFRSLGHLNRKQKLPFARQDGVSAGPYNIGSVTLPRGAKTSDHISLALFTLLDALI